MKFFVVKTFVLTSLLVMTQGDHCSDTLKDLLVKVQELEEAIKKAIPAEEPQASELQINESGFAVGGKIVALPGLSYPERIKIHWMNFVEGDDVRDGTAWTMITKSDALNETDFTINVSKLYINLY